MSIAAWLHYFQYLRRYRDQRWLQDYTAGPEATYFSRSPKITGGHCSNCMQNESPFMAEHIGGARYSEFYSAGPHSP
jgi:hypothetical protein